MSAALRYLLVMAAVCAAMLGSVAAVNVTVDIGGLYQSDHASKNFARHYIEALRASTHGLIQLPIEREIKIELAEQAKADCYVVGSSRVMAINFDRAPTLRSRCGSLVNLGVSGGGFEDAVIFLGILGGKARVHVLLEIPPWLLRPQADGRWQDVQARYSPARKSLGLAADEPAYTISALPVFAALNGDYFRRNVKALIDGSRIVGLQIRPAVLEADRGPDDGVMNLDGSYSYPPDYLKASPVAEHLIGSGTYKLSKFGNTSQKTISEFQTILETLLGRGVSVSFLLMPYHPKVFRCSDPWICDLLEVTEHLVLSIARRHEIEIVGSYDPRRFNLKHTDFYDDHHVGTGLARVFYGLSREAGKPPATEP